MSVRTRSYTANLILQTIVAVNDQSIKVNTIVNPEYYFLAPRSLPAPKSKLL